MARGDFYGKIFWAVLTVFSHFLPFKMDFIPDLYRSIPQLIPEEICREVPKQLCQTVFLSPRTVKVLRFY